MGFEVEEVWRSTETKAGAGRDEMRERVRRLFQATADEAGWSNYLYLTEQRGKPPQ